MNQFWTKSIILHITVVLLLAISSLKMCSKDEPPKEEMTITVDLMPIGEKTNVKPAPKKEVKQKPTPPKKQEEVKEEEKKPAKEKTKEPPKETPKPVDKPIAKPVETPKPTTTPVKPAEKTPPKKKQDLAELDNLLKNLADSEPEPEVESKETENTDKKSKSTTPVDMNAPLTMAEIDYIKTLIMKQIVPCWNVPAGARDAGSLQIRLDVDVERDGTIKFAGFSDEGRYNADAYYQVAADSARRAVLDPKCNPLKQLPPMDKYNKWHELTLTFDPSKLIY